MNTQYIHLRLLIIAVTYAGSLQLSRAAVEDQQAPFELHGIFRMGELNKASLRERNGEANGFWLQAGQSRGELSLVKIDPNSPTVTIRYGSNTHILNLHKANNRPWPLHLKSNVIEQDGRLMTKMRVPAGRGRSKSSSIVLTQFKPGSSNSNSQQRLSTTNSSTTKYTNDSSYAEPLKKNGDSYSEIVVAKEILRDFEIPERRASMRAVKIGSISNF